MRETENKKTGEIGYSYATGAKGWRWAEASSIESTGREKDIDLTYYDRLVNEAADAIGKYGDVEWFRSGEAEEFNPYPIIDPDEPPFDI